VLTTGLTPHGPVPEHVRVHGDGVRDVALRVDDAGEAMEAACALGAEAVHEVSSHGTVDGTIETGAVAACGDTIHSLVSRAGEAAALPGFRPTRRPARTNSIVAFDHVTFAVPLGDVDRQVGLYRDVFGFGQMSLAGLARVATERSALMSKVVEGAAGKIKFPIVEPAADRGRSQIDEFLEFYGSPGVQHVGLLTRDLAASIDAALAAGAELVTISADYYEETAPLAADLGLELDALRSRSILVDSDEDGHLLQAFMKPLHDRPTFFLEFVERHGSRGFGARNVKHLFNALEREQQARGNL
jgi:4-hydroxyphenylpyruvate dioxygenase